MFFWRMRPSGSYTPSGGSGSGHNVAATAAPYVFSADNSQPWTFVEFTATSGTLRILHGKGVQEDWTYRDSTNDFERAGAVFEPPASLVFAMSGAYKQTGTLVLSSTTT